MKQIKHIGVIIFVALLGAGCQNAVMTPNLSTEQSPASASEPYTPQVESVESNGQSETSQSETTEDIASSSEAQTSPVPQERDTQEPPTKNTDTNTTNTTSIEQNVSPNTEARALTTPDVISREEKDAFLTLLYDVVNTISGLKKPDDIIRLTGTDKIVFSLYGIIFDYPVIMSDDFFEILETRGVSLKDARISLESLLEAFGDRQSSFEYSILISLELTDSIDQPVSVVTYTKGKFGGPGFREYAHAQINIENPLTVEEMGENLSYISMEANPDLR